MIQDRVKNNMQLILRLLNRHQGTIKDPDLKSIFSERKEQIESIALVQQKIDLKASDKEVDPEEYLGELITYIERSYSGIFPEIKLNLSLAVDLIHIDAAVPLGLISNELVPTHINTPSRREAKATFSLLFQSCPITSTYE
jgi:two-component sensor histidine kinase